MAQSGTESTRAYSRSSTGTGIAASSSRRSLSSVSTTSLSVAHAHTYSNIDGNKPAVVIELGASLTKLGYAGEYMPRIIIRTEYIDDNLVVQKNLLTGVQESDKKSLSRLFRFFKYIYFTHLLTMPRERRVVIVESLLCPTHIRRAITTVLLELLDAPSVLFAPSPLLATFPFNTKTALLIDLGWKEVTAMPVVEGITMLSHWEAVPKGGQALTQRLRAMLEKEGLVEDFDGSRRPLSQGDWHIIEDTNILEDILVRGVFVTRMDRADAIRAGESTEPKTKELIVPMGTDTLVVPGIVRETLCELLFESNSPDELGLHEVVHSIVERCPIDIRRKLFSHLLVIGGLALIPGLLPRLKAEIVRLASVRGLKTCDSVGFYRFDKAQLEPYVAWIGGSMFGTLTDTLQKRSITKEDWAQRRILPDAIDFNDPFDRPTSDRTRS